MDKKTLFICVGTACHQLGVGEVLCTLERLVKEQGLEDRVELRGTFCGEQCEQAIFMRLDDTPFGHIRPHNIERVFREQICPRLDGKPVAAG